MPGAKKSTRPKAEKPKGDNAVVKAPKGRAVPRPFAFHWGSGEIIEEASFRGKYTEPAVQLLEYEGGGHEYGVRFCYYSLDGRFQRSPMMLDSADSLEGLRAALKKTPKLRAMIKRLAT